MGHSDEVDEILQALFCLGEGKPGPFMKEDVLGWADVGEDALRDAVEANLATEAPDGFDLTEAGRVLASAIVRRHRLAERLLHDVLRLAASASEPTACRFEHVLEDEVTESICTLLGHPRVCPHGKPIPPGACCTDGQTNVAAVMQRLSDLPAGSSGVVAYVHAATDSRIDRLASFGVVPGTELRVHQVWPSFVIEFGETHLALDRESAEEIFVRVAPGDWIGAGRGLGFRRRRRLRKGRPE